MWQLKMAWRRLWYWHVKGRLRWYLVGLLTGTSRIGASRAYSVIYEWERLRPVFARACVAWRDVSGRDATIEDALLGLCDLAERQKAARQ